ncbi:MAG: hypothetical protein NFW04_06775 [Candidatus Accumulibacter sp.]|uniref:hypothetical protein n=1 Tax=Accumulibacter sp. TaxID=2053492 RepID=UPI0025E11C44|nr:hypothetical protein [Accumulibacter sp.]MCM8598345.1 hypothetical protein [Accumulibacter sp.]MCM8663012.1 hypothetical protein [Accumulibacter sp.]
MSTRHVLRWVGAEAFVAHDIRPGPALLRFDGDDFMERMLATLADRPQDLPDLVAKSESWQKLGPATPTPPSLQATEKPYSRPARALVRARELLGFKRRDPKNAAQSPLSDRQALLAAVKPTAKPLKLFQPVHKRYYLAAAHLVCELPGLPPRVTAAGDKSGFVIRRLVGSGAREHGFVKDADGQAAWVDAGDHPEADTVAGEELLPVFPMSYTPPGGPARNLLAGLIPVARHDDYRFARRQGSAPPPGRSGEWSAVDDVKALARMKVIAPWQGLIERAYQSGGTSQGLTRNTPWDGKTPPTAATGANLQALNNQLVEASWRQLQEIREFLLATFKDLKAAMLASGQTGRSDRPALQALLDLLGQPTWSAPAAGTPADDQPQLSADVLGLADPYKYASLLAALSAIDDTTSATLDGMNNAFPQGVDWPGWAFPLAVLLGGSDNDSELDARGNVVLKPVPRIGGPFRSWPGFVSGPATEGHQDADNRRLELLYDRLAAAIVEADKTAALNASAQAPVAARLASELEASLKDDPGPPRYVVRFVHRRCDCGPLHPPVISAPSEAFELAGFFDPEAPLRPIRIALPFDTTPGGLRKFGKNSAFILSDVLCGQMKRVRRLGFADLVLSVLPWPFHKDLDVGAMGPCGGSDVNARFGTICSLSIPIITIVAFILLIVIATLLDLIFRWLPFLIACFPVPGLKGKDK